FLYAEWNNKAAGFVGYGLDGAARAIEHLRHILATVSVATVAHQVALSLYNDFVNLSEFKPAAVHEEKLGLVLDQALAWSGALRALRAPWRRTARAGTRLRPTGAAPRARDGPARVRHA